jgi:hypothetical protein
MPDKCSGSKPHVSRGSCEQNSYCSLSVSLLLHASLVLYVCHYSYYYYYYYYCVILRRTRYSTTDDVCLYLKFIDHNLCFQPFLWQILMWVSSRAARVQIAVNGAPNRLNYFVTFIIYTDFTNVAAVRIIQPGGAWVGSPWAVTSRILIVAVSFSVFT